MRTSERQEVGPPAKYMVSLHHSFRSLRAVTWTDSLVVKDKGLFLTSWLTSAPQQTALYEMSS